VGAAPACLDCGQRQHHEYQLYAAVENIDHCRTKARHPRTNGICERFHRTIQEEFYATAFRKKPYPGLEELQADLDDWLRDYNQDTEFVPASTAMASPPAEVLGFGALGLGQDPAFLPHRSAGAGAEPCAAERRRRRGR